MRPGNMKIGFTKDGEFGLLAIVGDLERLTPATLKHYIEMVVERACPYMIVDLTGVEKLSTSGLGLLFAGKNHLDDVGALMAIIGPERELHSLLTSASLGKMVPVCESVERAKIALRRLAFQRRASDRRKKRYED